MTVACCEYFYSVCWPVASRTWVSSPHFWWCESGYLIYLDNLSFPPIRQLYYWTYSLASKRWRNLLCWIVGCASCLYVWNVFVKNLKSPLDANTIGSVAALASIDWGAAVQVMAAITISTNGDFEVTKARLL